MNTITCIGANPKPAVLLLLLLGAPRARYPVPSFPRGRQYEKARPYCSAGVDEHGLLDGQRAHVICLRVHGAAQGRRDFHAGVRKLCGVADNEVSASTVLAEPLSHRWPVGIAPKGAQGPCRCASGMSARFGSEATGD
jgi:hypothetical protein